MCICSTQAMLLEQTLRSVDFVTITQNAQSIVFVCFYWSDKVMIPSCARV